MANFPGGDSYPRGTCWKDGSALGWEYGRLKCQRCGADNTPPAPPSTGTQGPDGDGAG